MVVKGRMFRQTVPVWALSQALNHRVLRCLLPATDNPHARHAADMGSVARMFFLAHYVLALAGVAFLLMSQVASRQVSVTAFSRCRDACVATFGHDTQLVNGQFVCDTLLDSFTILESDSGREKYKYFGYPRLGTDIISSVQPIWPPDEAQDMLRLWAQCVDPAKTESYYVLPCVESCVASKGPNSKDSRPVCSQTSPEWQSDLKYCRVSSIRNLLPVDSLILGVMAVMLVTPLDYGIRWALTKTSNASLLRGATPDELFVRRSILWPLIIVYTMVMTIGCAEAFLKARRLRDSGLLPATYASAQHLALAPMLAISVALAYEVIFETIWWFVVTRAFGSRAVSERFAERYPRLSITFVRRFGTKEPLQAARAVVIWVAWGICYALPLFLLTWSIVTRVAALVRSRNSDA